MSNIILTFFVIFLSNLTLFFFVFVLFYKLVCTRLTHKHGTYNIKKQK